MNQDTLSPLTAISPIDGRYRSKVEALSDSFSEYALIKWRLHVEIIYFISLYEAGFFEISELALPSI